jgi:hypothetical protein
MPRMKTADPVAGLEALAETLWAERQVVEFLLYKLVTAKLLLAADERRFVSHALSEVERVVDALRDAELRRSIALEQFARDRRMRADDVTLDWLATNTPPPWREVFSDHRTAFGELATEIETTSAENRHLAASGLSQIRQTIDTLTGPQTTTSTYDASGRARPMVVGPVRLDSAL